MSKPVATPEYWQQEEYQPLIETETVFGSRVKIPKNFLSSWEDIKAMGKKAESLSSPARVDSLKYIKDTLESMIRNRGKIAADFGRVMLETYNGKK